MRCLIPPAGWVWVVMCSAAASAGGITYYVDADAPGRNDGGAWEHAFTDLQAALAVAQEGDRVMVAQGLYRPAGAGGDRSMSFALVGGAGLYGGYAGYGAPDPDARDPNAYPTVLGGDLNGDDGANFENTQENSYHVVTATRCGAGTTLDGFLIVAGNANGPQWTNDHAGGGFRCFLGAASLRACWFVHNQGLLGGGASCISGSLRLDDCTFYGNRADDWGAGLFDIAGGPELTGCRFESNTSLNGGGAAIVKGDETVVRNCAFVRNTTSDAVAGGLFVGARCADVSGCLFSGNGTPSGGGGFTADYQGGAITDCHFEYNSCSYAGGALWLAQFGPGLYRCSFVHNSAMYGGAARATTTITDSLFVGNTAEVWGGAVTLDSGASLRQTTFVRNVAGVAGGALFLYRGTNATLEGAVLWGNGPDQLYIDREPGEFSVRYCLIQGGFPGEGNMDADPRFVDPDGGDYRLAVDSPAIDAGDPEFQQEPGERDLDGRPRVLCDRVDIGAYEFGSGDYDCDRRIDLDDYENWTACFTGPDAGPYPAGCEAFDFDFDADVDLADFAALMIVFAGE